MPMYPNTSRSPQFDIGDDRNDAGARIRKLREQIGEFGSRPPHPVSIDAPELHASIHDDFANATAAPNLMASDELPSGGQLGREHGNGVYEANPFALSMQQKYNGHWARQ